LPSQFALYVYHLDNIEQKAFFDNIPWIVKKVLLPKIWFKDYEPHLEFYFNPHSTKNKLHFSAINCPRNNKMVPFP
jgi:hypothetical protein